MVSDFVLPAKTEFSRGLEAHLAASLEYLWRMRQPSASQTNAVKYLRFHLTQLPNNVDEFDVSYTLVCRHEGFHDALRLCETPTETFHYVCRDKTEGSRGI